MEFVDPEADSAHSLQGEIQLSNVFVLPAMVRPTPEITAGFRAYFQAAAQAGAAADDE